jgi:DNA ligase-1
MREWSEVADAVAATRSTTAKVTTVAGYLRSLEGPELEPAVTFLSGRPFAGADDRTTGIGWRAVSDAVQGLAIEAAQGTDREPLSLGAAYDRSSDIGTAVAETLSSVGHTATGQPPTLAEVQEALGRAAAARGPAAKVAILRELLARCDPSVARAVVKVLTGELRIGLRQGHLEAAIAAAFDRDLGDVQWAAMLTGDIGSAARLARDDALGSARLALFRPLTCMLASPVADEAEALSRMSPLSIAAHCTTASS